MTEMISFRPIDHDLKNIKAILEANPHMRGNRSSAISLALDRLANGNDSFTVLDLLDMAGDKIEAQLRELEAVLDRDYEMDVVTHPKNARDKRHLALSHKYIKLRDVFELVSRAILNLPSEVEDMANPNKEILMKLQETHEGVKLESSLGGYQEFDERQREFTVPQFTQAIWDAIENWDWEAEGDESVKMLDALVGIDADYVRSVFADDDGMVRLDSAYKDVWGTIDEFARATAANM